MADLIDYAKTRKFIITPSVCAVLISEWIYRRTGIDPFPDGDCMSQTDVDAILGRPGGLPRAVGRVLRAAGFHMTSRPDYGDVAVISVAGKLVCAVRGNDFWFAFIDHPVWLSFGSVRVVASWRIECRKQ